MPKKKERGPGCPGRPYGRHSKPEGINTPQRPPKCPCLWTDYLIDRHFKEMLAQESDLLTRLRKIDGLRGE